MRFNGVVDKQVRKRIKYVISKNKQKCGISSNDKLSVLYLTKLVDMARKLEI